MLSNTERECLNESVRILRKVRDAVTKEPSAIEVALSNLSKILGREILRISDEYDTQKLLSETISYTILTAKYLVNRVINYDPLSDKGEYFEFWEEYTRALSAKLESYQAVNFANTNPIAVQRHIVGRCSQLRETPDAILNWEFCQNNKICKNNYSELITDNILVIAPFSGDILLLMLYACYIKETRGVDISTCGVILGPYLTKLIVPDDLSNKLTEASRWGIFLDVHETGQTAERLSLKIHNLC